MHETAEPKGGRLHERQRDPVERDDPRSGEKQPRRAPTNGSFNTQQKRRWINDVFQTQLREVEQELRATNSLAWTSSTGGGRVRGNVPESLVNRLGPLAMETGAAAPVAPSSDVRESLGTAPTPRRQPLESRLGVSIDQNQTSPRPCMGLTTRPLQQPKL